MTKISVVIPVYKAESCLHELYSRLRQTLDPISPEFEILFVEDGGGDRSWPIILDLALQDDRIKGLKLSRNFGQHPAISAGFENASGEYIVLMDCDLQDQPENIPLLIDALQDNPDIDIVYTIKKGYIGSWQTRFTSKLYHYTFSKITKIKVPENIGTFRAFNRKFLQAILQYDERNILYGPLMFYMGFNSVCIPITHSSRQFGRSTYSFAKRLALAVNSLVSYTDIPHRALTYIGLIVFASSGLYSFCLVLGYILFGRALAAGVTIVLLLTTMFLGIMMFSLGIIGSYVFRVYQEVLKRPRYLVSQTVNLK